MVDGLKRYKIDLSKISILDWGKIILVFLYLMIMTYHAASSSVFLSKKEGSVGFGGDFIAFHSAGKLAVQKEYDVLYDYEAFTSLIERPGLTFNYPPSSLGMWAVFNDMEFSTAYFTWVSVWLILLTILLVSKYPPLITTFILYSPLTLWAVLTGQTGLMGAVIVFSGLLLYEKEYKFLAGLVLGLLIFKPQLAFAIPICFVAAKEWRVIYGGILTCVVVLVVSTVVFDISAWQAFFSQLGSEVPPQLAANTTTTYKVPTVYRTVVGLSGYKTLAYSLQIFTAIVAIYGCWYVWSRKNDLIVKLITIYTGTILISPYYFGYDLVGLSIISGLLVWEIYKKQRFDFRHLIVVLIATIGLYANTYGVNYKGLGCLTIIIVFWYAVYRTRKMNSHLEKKPLKY